MVSNIYVLYPTTWQHHAQQLPTIVLWITVNSETVVGTKTPEPNINQTGEDTWPLTVNVKRRVSNNDAAQVVQVNQ
jgi:hypothetical protein